MRSVWDNGNKGSNLVSTKTAHYPKYLDQFVMVLRTTFSRANFCEMIKTRGSCPVFWLKLHVAFTLRWLNGSTKGASACKVLGLLPLVLIVSQKWALFWRLQANSRRIDQDIDDNVLVEDIDIKCTMKKWWDGARAGASRHKGWDPGLPLATIHFYKQHSLCPYVGLYFL